MRPEKDQLGYIFQALSAPTRRSILAQLAQSDAYVSDLAEPHQMTLAAVSRHVKVLANANLLVQYREGKNMRCTINADGLRSVQHWMEHYRIFWDQKLDALTDILEDGLE